MPVGPEPQGAADPLLSPSLRSPQPTGGAAPPRILAINPGSTSTKVAVFSGPTPAFVRTVEHPAYQLEPFSHIADQLSLRLESVNALLAEQGEDLARLAAVVGRGGLLAPLPGGTYRVDEAMLEDLREARFGEHASNLGALLAHAVASPLGIPAFIVDPVVVDELDPVARVTGIPEIARRSIFHALNQKAVARKAAAAIGKPYEEARLVVAHLGGGFSIGVHRNGRVVDVNNALDGEGPFGPNRAGTVPAGQLIRELARTISDGVPPSEAARHWTGRVAARGGLLAHLGTADCREVEARIANGNAETLLVYRAMAYQTAKAIGAAVAALKGRVDAIALTGGVARSARFVGWVREYVDALGPVLVFPGEFEMEALALGALRVLQGEEAPRSYCRSTPSPQVA